MISFILIAFFMFVVYVLGRSVERKKNQKIVIEAKEAKTQAEGYAVIYVQWQRKIDKWEHTIREHAVSEKRAKVKAYNTRWTSKEAAHALSDLVLGSRPIISTSYEPVCDSCDSCFTCQDTT